MEKVLNIYLSIFEAELRAKLSDMELLKDQHLRSIRKIKVDN